MAGSNDFTGQNIQDTYQRVLQLSSSSHLTDGTGSLVPLLSITASHAISASHEITFEVSSSHAQTASFIANGIHQLTLGEVNQLKNINSTSISSLQFGFLGSLNQFLNTTSSVNFAKISLADTSQGANVLLPPNAEGSNPHLAIRTENPSTLVPSIFLGGNEEDIISFVNQEGTVVATINQNGGYSGTISNGALINVSNTFSANQILNNNIELQSKNTAGQVRTLIELDSNNIVKIAATGQPTSLRSNGIISTTGSLIISGTNATSGFLEVGGHITASGNISSSNSIKGLSYIIGNRKFANASTEDPKGIELGNAGAGNLLLTHLTASGNISASKIRAGEYAGSSVFDIAAGAGGIDTDGAMSCTGFSNNSTSTFGGRLDIVGAGSYVQTPSYVSASQLISNGNITASGDISSSGELRGTFGNASEPWNARGSSYDFAGNVPFSVLGNITSSGNISSSGDIIFNSLTGVINGGTF